MTPSRKAEMVRRILEEAPFSVATLAQEAGISTASIYAWANEKRNPTAENLASLAAVLERRGGELQALADELRKAAGG